MKIGSLEKMIFDKNVWLGAIDETAILTIDLLPKDFWLVDNDEDVAVVLLQFSELPNAIH